MKIDANGAVGEAGASGDFGAGHSFDEAKNEGFAVGVGERTNGVEDGVGFGAGVRGVTGGRGDLFGLRGGVSEARQGLKEDIVHEIVDVGEGNAGKQEAVDHAGIAGVEKAEGGAITVLRGADESVVGATGVVLKIHGRWTGAGRAEFRECGHVGSMEMKSVSPGRRGETPEC